MPVQGTAFILLRHQNSKRAAALGAARASRMSNKTLDLPPERDRVRRSKKDLIRSTGTRLRRLAIETADGLAAHIKAHEFDVVAAFVADSIGEIDDVPILMALVTLQFNQPDLFWTTTEQQNRLYHQRRHIKYIKTSEENQ
jgi:hypothetical protein